MSSGVVRESDRKLGILFIAVLLASIVAASVAPFIIDASIHQSVAFLAAPFIVLGIVDMVTAKRWVPLFFSVAFPLALYLVSWEASFIVLALLAGSTGVAASMELADRYLLIGTLGCAERCNASPERGWRDRAVSFLFGIPKDFDARNIKINGMIRREKIPYDIMAKSMAPAFLLLILLWMYICASTALRSDAGDGLILVMTASLYIAAFSAPWAILAVVDARIGTPGSTFRLFDGFFDTTKHMALPLLIGLIIVAVAGDPGWGALELALVSAILCAIVVTMALVKFSNHAESEVVSDIHAAWSDEHPVDFYSGFDGRDGKHPLDDGVPGTPRRPADSCFPPQK